MASPIFYAKRETQNRKAPLWRAPLQAVNRLVRPLPRMSHPKNPFCVTLPPSNSIPEVIGAVKADQESLRLQKEFYEKSGHPLDTKQ